MLEAGDKPSTGEKPSPPSSTWSEVAPVGIVVKLGRGHRGPDLTPIPDLMEKTRFSHAIYHIT